MRALVLVLAILTLACGVAPVALAEDPPPVPPVPAVVPAGVTVGNVPVGGLTEAQAKAVVQAAFDEPLRMVYGKRRWRVTPAELGARAYIDGAVRRALAAAPGQWVELVVKVRGTLVRDYVRKLDEAFSKPALDSRVRLLRLRPKITKSKPGFAVRRADAFDTLVSALKTGQRGSIPLEGDVLEPEVTEGKVGPVVVIRRDSKRLFLYEGQGLVRRFGVATGQAAYPTPLGSFRIVVKWENPWWYPPDSAWAEGAEPIPPGPGNPLGTRWMGLSAPLVGIHGTPDAASIGYSASHGCIRMLIADAEWLFRSVEIGTPVFIVPA